jgi:hypothetical protein
MLSKFWLRILTQRLPILRLFSIVFHTFFSHKRIERHTCQMFDIYIGNFSTKVNARIFGGNDGLNRDLCDGHCVGWFVLGKSD